MDFSKYKIQVPKEGSAASLLEPNHINKFFDETEIYPYSEGIKLVLKENRGLWLPGSLMYNEEVMDYFKEIGVNGF